MCGIFGISYSPGNREDWSTAEIAEIMFTAINHRGYDAYGFSWLETSDDESKIWYHKRGLSVGDDMDTVRGMLDNQEPAWLIGHVRMATHGTPLVEANNHPILHGAIVGVHNGVIHNADYVIRDAGGRHDSAALVDSEAIFAAVSKWGLVKGLEKVRGNAAVAYASTNYPDVLTLARTYGSPLVIARTAAGSLIFASEQQAIEALELPLVAIEDVDKEGIAFKIRGGQIYREASFKPNRQYRPQVSYGRYDSDGYDRDFYGTGRYWGSAGKTATSGREITVKDTADELATVGDTPTLEQSRAISEALAEEIQSDEHRDCKADLTMCEICDSRVSRHVEADEDDTVLSVCCECHDKYLVDDYGADDTAGLRDHWT